MDELKRKIQNNQLLVVSVCIVLGIALHYGYGFMRGALSPIAIFIGRHVTDPYSQHLWLQTLFINILYSALCGLLVALLALGIMQYFIRPKSMLYPELAAMPYVILSYWWFVKDVNGFMQVATNEQILTTLLSPLSAILVWVICSWWLIRKNSPNQALKHDARKARAS